MIPISRRARDGSASRAGAARRGLRPRARFAVERLETRFLLAGSGIDPVSTDPGAQAATGLATSPGASIASSASQGLGSETSVTPADDSGGGAVDTFVLEADFGEPLIQAELRWGDGPDPADGNLVLLDASGEVIFAGSLAGLSELRTSIAVPAGGEGTPSTATLTVDLAIQRPSDGSTDPGSFRLSLGWTSSPAPIASVAPPSTAAGPDQTPDALLAPAPLSGLVATGPLPTAIPSPVAADPITPATSSSEPGEGDDPGSAGSPGGSSSIVLPNPPSTLSAASLPPTGPTSASGSTAPPSLSAGRAATGATGAGSASVVASASTDATSPTFVGPLPFGASTPDGGIFGRSSSQATLIWPDRSTDRRASAASVVPVARLNPTDPEGAFRSLPGASGGLGASFALPRLVPARPGQAKGGAPGPMVASEPASVGAAFLPPIGTFSGLDRRNEPPSKAEVSKDRWPRGGRANPVVAVLAALTSSAAMVLTLGGLDRVRTSDVGPSGGSA